MDEEHASSKTLPRWIFGVTTAVVLAALLATDFDLLPPRGWLTPWDLGLRGFFGAIFAGIVAFSCQVSIALWHALKTGESASSEEEQERLIEQIMTPALRGEVEPPAWLQRALAVPGAVCLGLFAGSVLAWLAVFVVG